MFIHDNNIVIWLYYSQKKMGCDPTTIRIYLMIAVLGDRYGVRALFAIIHPEILAEYSRARRLRFYTFVQERNITKTVRSHSSTIFGALIRVYRDPRACIIIMRGRRAARATARAAAAINNSTN